MSHDKGNEGTGNVPVFVQTGTPTAPEMDRWQQVGEDEARQAHDMTLRNELSGGTPVVREFEKRWRDKYGSRYAITVSNGSSALYSAFFGIGLGPGDEFICPTYTWICSLSGALMLGARPVFCESDPDSVLLDPEDVRRRITDKTRAIIAVHLWGNVCDMDALMTISRETGIPVIEDCSHAHGAMYKGRPVGTMGAAGCWSLQGSKPVSAGEGGMLATDDIEIFERACLLGQVNRVGGLDLQSERYSEYQPYGIGLKTRAHPLGIGIAAVQFDKLDALNARRGQALEAIERSVAGIPCLRPVKVHDGAQRGGFYGWPMHYLSGELGGLDRAVFIEKLNREGIRANPGFYPLLHTLPLFSRPFDLFTRNRGPLCGDYQGYKAGDFPRTEEMWQGLIFLPVLSDPAPSAAEATVDALRRVVDRHAPAGGGGDASE